MVKTAQFEEDLPVHFNTLVQQGVTAEVGLLLGQAGETSRDFVFGVAPCPPRNNARSAIVLISTFAPTTTGEAGGKAKKGGSAAKPSISCRLDVDWVCEHGVQVERMLPGGLQVVGVYVYTPEVGYQSAVAEICTLMNELMAAGVCPSQNALLLHVDVGAKRYVLRSCSEGAKGPADLKPAELKYGPGMKNLVCLRGVYHVDMVLPVGGGVDCVQRHAEQVVAAESQAIRSCHVLHESRFPEGSSLLTDLLPKDATAAEPWNVQLYRPLDAAGQPSSTAGPGSTGLQVVGRGRVLGTLEGRVYCNKRATFDKCAAELKEDLCRSLKIRLDLLVEEAERWSEQAKENHSGAGEPPCHSLLRASQLARQAHYNLPFRVFLPWKAGLTLCDYLMPGETLENSEARMKDMLAVNEVDGEQVQTAERLDDAPASRSARACGPDATWSRAKWDPHVASKAVAAAATQGAGLSRQAVMVLVTVLMAALAVVLGMLRV